MNTFGFVDILDAGIGTPEAEAELNAGADGKEAEDEARDADIDARPACARARPKKLASLTGSFSGFVPKNAHGATHRRTHLELWCYADLAGLIQPWKPDN